MVRRTDQRLALDTLMARLRDERFAARLGCPLSFRKTSDHVNPLMLAGCTRDSRYVREWRRHAAECPACASLFEYFGLD